MKFLIYIFNYVKNLFNKNQNNELHARLIEIDYISTLGYINVYFNNIKEFRYYVNSMLNSKTNNEIGSLNINFPISELTFHEVLVRDFFEGYNIKNEVNELLNYKIKLTKKIENMNSNTFSYRQHKLCLKVLEDFLNNFN